MVCCCIWVLQTSFFCCFVILLFWQLQSIYNCVTLAMRKNMVLLLWQWHIIFSCFFVFLLHKQLESSWFIATFLYFICRYESTVAGQFFGHAHPSFYAMVYDDVKFTRPVSVIYVPGSVTTFSNLNPGYRIYTIDGFYENSTWVR